MANFDRHLWETSNGVLVLLSINFNHDRAVDEALKSEGMEIGPRLTGDFRSRISAPGSPDYGGRSCYVGVIY